MKNRLLLLTFTLLSSQVYCQSKNSISFVYGTASDNIFDIGIGGPGFQSKGDAIYGINYVRALTKSFSIETGLEYAVNNLLWDYEDAYDPTFTPQKVSVRMLSIPVYANFTFFKYFFTDAGLTADFETGYKTGAVVTNQSGIGIGLGIGGKYDFKKIRVFINPFLQMHAIAAFHNEGGGSLVDQGVKIGLGYRF